MEGEFKDKDQWYNNCKDFWGKSESSVQGVMIGNDHVQEADIKASCELLEGLIKTKKLNPDKVLDCGAGIGRVTNNVLVKYFTECDLLEQDEKFIQFSKEFFSNEPKVKNYFQNSIQNFEFV
jgi:protein N-terminal methyltransferase